MTGETITIHVDAAERAELAARAERDKVTLSEYVRVRLGLRGRGPQSGDPAATDAMGEPELRAMLADHEHRLAALEGARGLAGPGTTP